MVEAPHQIDLYETARRSLNKPKIVLKLDQVIKKSKTCLHFTFQKVAMHIVKWGLLGSARICIL